MTLAYPLDDPRTARPASALGEAFDRHGVRMTFERNEEIYAQDDAVELLYRVAVARKLAVIMHAICTRC